MERSSEAYDELVRRILEQQEKSLQVHVREVLTTGTTTITEPAGTFQVTLKRPWWRSGDLLSEGHREGRSTRSWGRVPRDSDDDFVGHDILIKLAQGLVFLRQE